MKNYDIPPSGQKHTQHVQTFPPKIVFFKKFMDKKLLIPECWQNIREAFLVVNLLFDPAG
ncbi:MAG: hypothetical protein WCJ84_00110 [Candidatus Peregrinibacteria bacterium]